MFFKKKKKEPIKSRFNGPGHLQNHTSEFTTSEEHSLFRKFIPRIEWRGKLKYQNEEYFRIYYFGNPSTKEHFIFDKNGLPTLIIAETDNGSRIVVYDKRIHGFEGGILETYDSEQSPDDLDNRIQELQLFGQEKHKVLIQAYYNHDQELFEEEYQENIEAGQLILESSKRIDLEEAFDNSFDFFSIILVAENGAHFEIIADELA